MAVIDRAPGVVFELHSDFDGFVATDVYCVFPGTQRFGFAVALNDLEAVGV